MKKKGNFEITFTCKELGIEFKCQCYSSEIGKLIKKAKSPKEKAQISSPESSIILMMLELWEQGELVVPGKNGIEALGKFIYDTFNIPGKRTGKGGLTLSTIKSELYRLKS